MLHSLQRKFIILTKKSVCGVADLLSSLVTRKHKFFIIPSRELMIRFVWPYDSHPLKIPFRKQILFFLTFILLGILEILYVGTIFTLYPPHVNSSPASTPSQLHKLLYICVLHTHVYACMYS